MNKNVTIRIFSLILILTTFICFFLSDAFLSASAETLSEEIPEETTTILTEASQEEKTIKEEIKPGYIPKNVPLYDQRKYSRILFGECTVATDGCGITCAAMAISYFTEYKMEPDYYGLNYNVWGQTNEWKMLRALHDFNIEVTEYYGKKSWDTIYKALEDGHLVISLQDYGTFSLKPHFILLTGLTEDGRITVNDPYGRNYKKSYELRTGFKKGFEDYQIYRSCGKYYILDFTGCFIPFGIKPSPIDNVYMQMH